MKTIIASTFVVGLSFACCGSTQAQDTPGSSGGAIVVLDVAKVFKSSPNFNEQIESIQDQAEKLKADVENRQRQLRDDAQEITEKFKANTPERKQAEAKVEQDMTTLRTQARQAESDLMAQEAKVYYETYLQMQAIVAQAAKDHGIALVLRFDSSEIDPNNRNSVVGGVNRPVVFQRDRDLTGYVIEQMNLDTKRSANVEATQIK